MSLNTWRHVTSGLISFAILAAGVAGFRVLTSKAESTAEEPTVALPQEVVTIPLDPHLETLDISVDGTVVPFREISTSAEVAGRVQFKAPECDAGRFVTAGTELLRIDPSDYQFEIDRLGSQLREAIASITELKAEIKNTGTLIKLAQEDLALHQRELARMTNLAGGNIVTASDLDRAKQAELGARNALALLQNQEYLQNTRQIRLEASRDLVATQLEKAALDKTRTIVLAATDGVVVTDFVEQGDYVQKGEPLFTLEDTSAVEVKCSLQMDELYWLWRSNQSQASSGGRQPAGRYEIPAADVIVSYELPQSGIRYQWNGVLSRFDGIGLDEKTRTVPCRVLVKDPFDVTTSSPGETPGSGPRALLRGMYVDVKIKIENTGNLVSIPEHYVRPGKALWVARDGKLRVIKPLRLIALTTGEEDDFTESHLGRKWIVDASGSRLMPGDLVITNPLAAVYDGMDIRLKALPAEESP